MPIHPLSTSPPHGARAAAFAHARRAPFAVLSLAACLLALTATAGFARQDADASQAERDARFETLMEGARLVGEFTVDTGQTGDAPRPDLYSVSELEKGEGDVWIFHYTMSYGGNQGTTFDIPVRVVWVEDTPMITMTDQQVEGLGTFTVRVMIHGDRYAGTWQHGAFGGHMWGKIEHGEAASGEPGASTDGEQTPPGP